MLTLDTLRSHAIARTLFAPTSLLRAIRKLGFVQADPMRAPARAQDLTLRHRVKGYVAGDLERRYPTLGLEEDFFINHGFLRREHHALMHPRAPRSVWSAATRRRAEALLAFVRERGCVHPREVDAHFAHGRATNAWGGSSNATTHLLDAMHYRGLLRVVRRDGGVRIYAARDASTVVPAELSDAQRLDALVDLAVQAYAPLPATSLAKLVHRLRIGAPQWAGDRADALARAKARLGHARVDGVDWYWPAPERPLRAALQQLADEPAVRLLAPFDPLVWDRHRFELFWGWAYRFEAYTPAAKRLRGHYALPLLWRDQVIGWGNLAVAGGQLRAELGYVSGRAPREAAFRPALAAELQRMRVFLGLPH